MLETFTIKYIIQLLVICITE